MSLFRTAPPPSVSKCGAFAGCVLRGSGRHNEGLRLKVLHDQVRGNEGAIKGPFVILDTGDNRHSSTLQSLLNQETDAGAVVEIIRREHPGCVNVANANSLVAETR
jgi:hypothetical protein